ncbi:MAG: ABC transporter permease [Sedimentisphaerales bacterium]|nr:ABC transporter permease [Sedimentisphaerales bacterium]
MSLFNLKGTVKLGLKSLWMHKMRSTLTTLGIVFGVCSVIAMLAIGEGASREAQAAIARLGSTNLIIETVKPPEKQADTGQSDRVTAYGLTYSDAESIQNTFSHIQVVVPVREMPGEARYETRKVMVKVIGSVPWYNQINPIRLLQGRFLSSTDVNNTLSVCVIDESLARRLFAFEEAIGQYIKISGGFYRVVGVVSAAIEPQPTGRSSSNSPVPGGASGVVGNVYMPITTLKAYFSDLNLSLTGTGRTAERVELQKIIVKVEGNKNVIPTRNLIDTLLKRLHEKNDYQIVVPLELLREAERNTRIFSIVLGSIAAISLLVGGIGIMNIMLATVSERTREIGIRRALGAKKTDIIFQFLAETLLLTFLGGFIGVLLGSIIPFLVTKLGDMVTVITLQSLVLAFGISAMIGLTFGLYPAWHAANMNPIESLRHE